MIRRRPCAVAARAGSAATAAAWTTRCSTMAIGAAHVIPMPTTRPRLTITETDDVAAALEAAATRWPEVRSRRELLLRLVEQGREVLEGDRDDAAERRRAALRRTSGALTGTYEPDYLERLRADWPA